jgi:putative sigma-54 modulation protein
MTVEKLDRKIEVNCHLAGKDIHVEANDGDMYAAIDRLTDKLDRQVLKHKERFSVNRHHVPGIKRTSQA